jgi:hypothetical protein
MTRPIPFLFARYRVGEEDEDWDGPTQLKMLRRIRGKRFDQPYSRSPVPDTLAMSPGSRTVGGYQVLTWIVGYKVLVRTAVDYDDLTDALKINTFEGEGVRYEDFVAVPALGVMAISDRTGEQHIGARNAISRFQTVIRRGIPGAEAVVSLGVTDADVEAALKQWKVSEFSFTVRPFNPRVRQQGRKVHEALVDEKAAMLRGTLRAEPGEGLKAAEGGFINEAVGLYRMGYGQIGFRGEMPDGQNAQLKKPEFSQDKAENLEVRESGTPLRVFISPQTNARKEVEELAKALIAFYERDQD